MSKSDADGDGNGNGNGDGDGDGDVVGGRHRVFKPTSRSVGSTVFSFFFSSAVLLAVP